MTELSPLQAELMRFLLDEEAIGESQCKIPRVVQCSCIPKHKYGDAKDAVGEMISNRDVPVFSKGGGERDVIHISSSRVQEAKEMVNSAHPKREPGQSFDRTDLSTPDKETAEISTEYNYKGDVWHVLEQKGVEFTHQDGFEFDPAPDDHIVFEITGTEDEVIDALKAVTEATNGGALGYSVPEISKKKKAVA